MTRILSLTQEEINELRSILSSPSHSSHLGHYLSPNFNFEFRRSFFLRMKCVLAKRNAGLTTQGYKVSEKPLA